MSIVSISWRPDKKALRKFGLVVIIGLCLIGLFFQFYLEKTTTAYALYAAAAILGLPALTGTAIALPGYWLWMGIAFVMGNIMGRVLLSILFYGLITPMGFVRRMSNDKLRIRRKSRESYWVDIRSEGEEGRYERLF
jgi:hypothetical protein